jgi:hypothetical protein
MTLKTTCLATALLLAAAAPALAHHSFAMFANDKVIEVHGTVRSVEWVNPHSWIHLTALDKKGMPQEWAFEMGSPGMMAAHGWHKDSLKTGDKVTVEAHPMKDPQAAGGSEIAVVKDDGKVLSGEGKRPAKPGSAPSL